MKVNAPSPDWTARPAGPWTPITFADDNDILVQEARATRRNAFVTNVGEAIVKGCSSDRAQGKALVQV